MLLLFALTITPKQLLHDVISGHKHSYIESGELIWFQSSKNNFQCNWHNDAVESPFTGHPELQVSHPCNAYSSGTDYYILNHYSAERFFYSLRGPPPLV